MKKLLLALALPLMLVGCTNNNETTKQGTWVSLVEKQTLTVYCGSDEYNYSLQTYSSVDFRVDFERHSYTYVTAIQVKAVYSSKELNFEFKGNTISYVLITE